MKQRKVTRQAATGNQTQYTLACAASGLPLIDEKPVVHLGHSNLLFSFPSSARMLFSYRVNVSLLTFVLHYQWRVTCIISTW